MINSQLRETIQVLLQGRQFVFTLLHTLFGAEPTEGMLLAAAGEESLGAILLFEEGSNTAAARLREALLPLRQMTGEKLHAIRQEYTDLFLGPGELIAPPWESVYLTRERALFQTSTLAVHKWYERYGFLPEGYPHYPDDHISLMFHFLGLLTGEALGFLADGRLEDCRNILEAQRLFEQNHLISWLPHYAKAMAQSPAALLYPQLADAARRLAEEDGQLIDELIHALK